MFTFCGVQDQEAGGNSAVKQKRWTASQCREMGDLHALLAFLVLSCRLAGPGTNTTHHTRGFPPADLLPVPPQVERKLRGGQR